jgi:hypothetical protein
MPLHLADVTVVHNERFQRFEAVVDGLASMLAYVRTSDRIVFDHTEVPSRLQGHGLAAKLTQTALDFAREARLRVVPKCSYVAAYLRKHPEYHALLDPEDLRALLSQK